MTSTRSDEHVGRRLRWARAGLACYVLLLALAVLLPTSPMRVVRIVADWIRALGAWFVHDGWVEAAANVVMFVPFAALLALSVRRRPAVGLLIACATSVGIELAQLVLPGREASVRDVVTNVTGAVIGYLLAKLVLRWTARRRAAAR